jgi:alkylhydroperoxidase family enzyme
MKIEPHSPATNDPAMRELTAKAAALGVPDPRFAGLLARVPGYAQALLNAQIVSHDTGAVDHKLKEIIRIQLARFVGDGYFANLRSTRARAARLDEATITAGRDNYERDPRFSEAERVALRYADLMYLDANQIDAAFYAELKKHYSEAQIMELGAFIAFQFSMQKFMLAMDRLAAPPG